MHFRTLWRKWFFAIVGGDETASEGLTNGTKDTTKEATPTETPSC